MEQLSSLNHKKGWWPSGIDITQKLKVFLMKSFNNFLEVCSAKWGPSNLNWTCEYMSKWELQWQMRTLRMRECSDVIRSLFKASWKCCGGDTLSVGLGMWSSAVSSARSVFVTAASPALQARFITWGKHLTIDMSAIICILIWAWLLTWYAAPHDEIVYPAILTTTPCLP